MQIIMIFINNICYFRNDLAMRESLNAKITVVNAFELHGSVTNEMNVPMVVMKIPNCVVYVFFFLL